MNDYYPESVKPGMVNPLDSEQLLYILNQQKECCCKINSTVKGTDFFVK